MKSRTLADIMFKCFEAIDNKLGIIEDGHIILCPEENHRYPIELSRCNTYPKIVEWIHHLTGKNWVKTRHIRRFISLACKTHGLEFYGHDE